MFNLGFGEILIICAVLIIVVGPERLPTLMKTVGKTLRTVRQASQEIKATVGLDEIMREDITRPLPPPKPRLAPVATVSRDGEGDKPAPTTDTISGTVSGPVTGAPPSQGAGTAGEPAEEPAAEIEGNAPRGDAGDQTGSRPVMWAGVPEGKVVPYAPPAPPAVPSLAEADGMSISERMLLLHSPPPAPVEPPPVVVPPNTNDTTDSRRDTPGAATTPDANRAGDAGGDKGVG
jgi:sec-independent protein translocase protein TatB